MKPKIGITCKKSEYLNNYPEVVKEHGGVPIPLPSIGEPIPDKLSSIPTYLEEFDGVLFTGGGDIEPYHYFQERRSVSGVSKSRDALEIRLCQKALRSDIPIFGICRGIQVMSVAMWGNLYQDIDSEYPDDSLRHPKSDGADSRHEIQIEQGSLLSRIVGKNSVEVNSAHHQAVDQIGDGFVVTARSNDGIIEAIEDKSKTFVLGVQYHPERMLETDEFLEHRSQLFNAFIESAKNWRSKKNGV